MHVLYSRFESSLITQIQRKGYSSHVFNSSSMSTNTRLLSTKSLQMRAVTYGSSQAGYMWNSAQWWFRLAGGILWPFPL